MTAGDRGGGRGSMAWRQVKWQRQRQCESPGHNRPNSALPPRQPQGKFSWVEEACSLFLEIFSEAETSFLDGFKLLTLSYPSCSSSTLPQIAIISFYLHCSAEHSLASEMSLIYPWIHWALSGPTSPFSCSSGLEFTFSLSQQSLPFYSKGID